MYAINNNARNYRMSTSFPMTFDLPKKIDNSKKVKQNQPFYEKILNIYSSHSHLGESFKIYFFAFLPRNGLDNLNSIPDFVNFRFSFWDFGEFYTPLCFLEKPEKFEINHLLTSPHLPIIQYNMTEKREEDAVVEINYDPSVNNYISYKTFLNYLMFRDLFVEIYDYEKKIPFGYFKFPLSKFLRPYQKTFTKEQIETKVFDNFTHEQKGYIILDLESKEMKTEMPFNILTQSNILNVVDSNDFNKSENVKKRNIISEISSNKGKILNHFQEEEKNYLKNIDKINLSIIGNKTFFGQTSNYKDINSKLNDFNLDKKNKISQTISNFNKDSNNLTISLIQGEPHFFNFIIHNNSSKEEKYFIKISSDSNKYSNNDEKILSFVSNAEEWEYITMIKNLKIPNNYHSISENGFFILEENTSIPLLFKCISYKSYNGLENDFQANHTAIIYDIKGIAKYNLNVKIEKVFPIIDFEFYYRIPLGTNKKIEFINPYKNSNILKSKQLLKNCVFVNGNNKKYEIPRIEIDDKTNDFYFIFNHDLDFADNKTLTTTDILTKNSKSYNSKVDLDLFNNKKLLFLYKDKFGVQLLLSYRFHLLVYEYIDIPYNFGTKMKNFLPIRNEGEEPIKFRFYSSDSNEIYFDNSYKSGLLVPKNDTIKIEYTLYLTKRIYNKEIQINCLNNKNKEIYKTWIIRPNITKLNIIQTITINFLKEINNDLRTGFEFKNPLNIACLINFFCSTKTVIYLPINQINFNINEKKKIIINIRKILIPQKVTAYIFINDENNLFHQVIQFNINYF